MLRKVLVANRGEIARRVFRTCRERGIASVAIYSDVDAQALHVGDADEAVGIGGRSAHESYLDGRRVIEAARRAGATAIHPGYGFLSENSEFAHACTAAGLVFVGPPAAAMEAMGDKVRARRAMVAAGVPVVPGRDDVASAAEAAAVADEIGFPIMLKASAGGGGKGMRVVERAADVARSFAAAAREAQASFGDPRMFVERAITRARHVEIQVMADGHGNVVHLGERDCSVQRRHQKVIEETPCPSPQMSPQVRAQMGDVAVRAAQAVGYVGAGTVEFLFEETDDGPRFFFLEMNTRLQVEHPVTEAVTGRDLVWDQLRVAAGERLGFDQSDIVMSGHAIECRIYAEDPVSFLPRPGRVSLVRWPQGPSVRIDAAVGSGSAVPMEYDPMIAKLTVWGRDREQAVLRMRAALRDAVILGVEHNLPLCRRVFAHPVFASGAAVTTRFLDDYPEVRTAGHDDATDCAVAVAAAAGVRAARMLGERATHGEATLSAWRRSARWRTR